jgi:hypothetical protein
VRVCHSKSIFPAAKRIAIHSPCRPHEIPQTARPPQWPLHINAPVHHRQRTTTHFTLRLRRCRKPRPRRRPRLGLRRSPRSIPESLIPTVISFLRPSRRLLSLGPSRPHHSRRLQRSSPRPRPRFRQTTKEVRQTRAQTRESRRHHIQKGPVL